MDADLELWAWWDQQKVIMDEEANRRCEAKAKELGFSCWKEYDKQYREECRRAQILYKRDLDEKCAILGKTIEEVEAEDPQRYIPDDDWLAQCDCDGECISAF